MNTPVRMYVCAGEVVWLFFWTVGTWLV